MLNSIEEHITILIYRPTYIFCFYRPVAAGHFRPSSSGGLCIYVCLTISISGYLASSISQDIFPLLSFCVSVCFPLHLRLIPATFINGSEINMFPQRCNSFSFCLKLFCILFLDIDQSNNMSKLSHFHRDIVGCETIHVNFHNLHRAIRCCCITET